MVTSVLIWLGITLVLTLCAERLAVLFTDFHYRRKMRWIFVFVHAAALMICTLFVFNSAGFYSLEADLSADINTPSSKLLLQRANAYLDSNFILIDNSSARLAIHSVPGSRSTTDVTNREDLAAFLELLQQHQDKLDLVILDIGFSDPDPQHDKRLEIALKQLVDSTKLILAGDIGKSTLTRQLPDSIFGETSYKGTDEKFNYHLIKSNQQYSLPYLIYQRLDRSQPIFNWCGILVEKRRGRTASLHLNSFSPDLPYTGPEAPVTDADRFSESDFKTSWKLEEVAAGPLAADLVSDLGQRKKAGFRNAIFIGDFSGVSDVHLTAAGRLPGPVILYNIFYNLHRDEHRLSGLAVLIWFLASLVLTCLLIWDALLESRPDVAEQLLPVRFQPLVKAMHRLKQLGAHQHYWKRILGFLGISIVENAYLIFLVLVLIVIKRFTGVFVNGLWLFYYTVVFKKTLSYFTSSPVIPNPSL